MECELVRLAGVPLGLVTSTLFYASDSGSQQVEGPSEQAEEVMVGVCPTGRLIAFIASFKAQFVVCTDPLSVSSNRPVTSYQTSYEGLLKVVRDPNKPRPVATALIVISVALETKREPSSIVMVGFTDGHIRAYSKMGTSLLSQSLHGEPVVKIRCMAPSGDHRQPTINHMSVLVVFKSAVCIMEGQSVCEAIGHAVTTRDQWEEDAPVISYQKWRLGEQNNTSDAVLLAPSVPTAFDYLTEASNVGGYDTVVRGGPSPQSRLISVGESPMVALYKISKDAGTVNMSEVVSAVASKMTRSVLGKLSQAGGWLGWGGGATPPSRPKPQEKKLVMNIPMSTNIPDDRRSVNSISVSPLGDLSACVDCFGRVLLLDNHTMTVRRMWKGYRDAQTSWILVHESLPKQGIRKAAVKTYVQRPSEEFQRRAQCLCIYLPRRGIVELWPVQSGSRVAVFQVGKGCRLLSAPHGVFTASEQNSQETSGRGIQHTAVLLCPNRQLLSFIVPFPTLVRLNDCLSHDAHLIQRMSPALHSGDTVQLLQTASSLKTAQFCREAVEYLVSAYPLPDLPSDFLVKVLNLLLNKTAPTDPTHRPLRHYLCGVRQLLQLTISLDDVCPETDHVPPSATRLPQMLMELCGMAESPAREAAAALQLCMSSAQSKPRKQVVKELSLKELLQCFNLPRKVGSAEVASGPGEVGGSLREPAVVPMELKTSISESTRYDLGVFLFQTLITRDIAEQELKDIFQTCGIPSPALLSLLSVVLLSGRVVESNPSLLLKRLHKLVEAITCRGDLVSLVGEGDPLSDIREQCSHTHSVGHAFMMALLCQKVAATEKTEAEKVGEGEGGGGGEGGRVVGRKEEEEEEEGWEGDWGGEEAWETVTEEAEQWVRLLHRLQILTVLCGAVGPAVMGKMPPVPYCRVSRAGEELEVRLLTEASLSGTQGGVSMASLEAVGPSLTTHCVASWLVGQSVPPDFITTMPSDPADAQESDHLRVVCQLAPILRLLCRSLAPSPLLVHCAWQAAYRWRMEPAKEEQLWQYALQCVGLIPEPQLLAGTIVFLWHSLFEGALTGILDVLKRGSQQDSGAPELVAMCRNMFCYLHQLSELGQEGGQGVQDSQVQDMVAIPTPPDKHFVMDIIPTLPRLPATLVHTYFTLLLHTEVAMLLGSAHNIVTFYPTWVRGALKKGVCRVKMDSRQDQTPVQLQQKRTKFLCDTVVTFLDSPVPKLHPSISSVAIRSLTPASTSAPSLEVTEFTSALFLLGELWGVEMDAVHKQLVICLFAAGLGNRGREAFQSIERKSRVCPDLLSLAGYLTDHLIRQIASKPDRLALTAQVPPTLLEWIRKQSSSGVAKHCPKLAPTWSSLAQLISLIQPHLTSAPSPSPSQSTAASIARELAKAISLRTT